MTIKSSQLEQKISYPRTNGSSGNPEFPSPRYFQIHFEHLESQLDATKYCLELLQKQVADLYLRIAALSPESTHPKEEK